MNDELLETHLKFYGISPWEIEVIYGYLNDRFTVVEEEIEQDDEDYVTMLDVEIPLTFNQEFFQWFDFRRWENLKKIFKEMKRRRREKHTLKIQINFAGTPNIRFIVDTIESQWFNMAVEKIDFVLELLPYHLDPKKLPENISEVIYKFDPKAARWRLNTVFSGDKKFVFKDDGWKIVKKESL
jgi:hypothetical protein